MASVGRETGNGNFTDLMELREKPTKCDVQTLVRSLFTEKKKTFLRCGGNLNIDGVLDDLKEFFLLFCKM